MRGEEENGCGGEESESGGEEDGLHRDPNHYMAKQEREVNQRAAIGTKDGLIHRQSLINQPQSLSLKILTGEMTDV